MTIYSVKTEKDYRKALEPFLGGRSSVSEVMNRKRSLSISQIGKLHDRLDIPLENLVGGV